MKLEVNDRSRV